MRKALRWRYYCEFCRKASGHKYAMKKHEISCTANPNRICKACRFAGERQKPLQELLEVVKMCPMETEWDGKLSDWRIKDITPLRQMANGCPACILAALRASKLSSQFNFKTEMKDFLDRIDDPYRGRGE